MGGASSREELQEYLRKMGADGGMSTDPRAMPPPPPPAASAPPPARGMGSYALDEAARLASNPAMSTTVLGAGISALAQPRANDANARAFAKDMVSGADVGQDDLGPFGPPAPPGAPRQQPPADPKRRPSPMALRSPSVGGGGLARLKANYDAAVQGQFGSFAGEQDLNAEYAQEETHKTAVLARMQQMQADQMREQAEIQARHDQAAAEKHEAFLARSEQLADQIGKMEINPRRLMQNKTGGERALFILGSALSGGLGAMAGGGGSNDFLNRYEREVDQDIKSQIANVDNKKAQVSARQSVFQQVLAETGDRRLAEMQTRKMMWDSADTFYQSKAKELGIPEIMTRAALASNAIQQQKIDPLKTEIAKQSYNSAVAAANAAAAAEKARAEERRSRFNANYKELLTAGASEEQAFNGAGRMDGLLYGGLNPDFTQSSFGGKESAKRAEDARARFVPTGTDKTTGAPTGYMAATAAEAADLKSKREGRAKMAALIDRALEVRKEAGMLGRAFNRGGVGEGGLLYTPEWRNQLRTIKSQMELEYPKTISGANRLNEKELELANRGLPDLEAMGGSAEEKLSELKRNMATTEEAERGQAAGQNATKLGDQRTLLMPGMSAPANDATRLPGEQPLGGLGGGGGAPPRSDARAKQYVSKVRGGAGAMYSDDRVKLKAEKAAAWDEGHQAAVQRLQEFATLPPDQLEERAKKSDLAYFVRRMKADTYDEARGGRASISPMMPPTRAAGLAAAQPPPAPPPPPYPAMLAANNPNASPSPPMPPTAPQPAATPATAPTPYAMFLAKMRGAL